jgi:hypothetical protein
MDLEEGEVLGVPAPATPVRQIARPVPLAPLAPLAPTASERRRPGQVHSAWDCGSRWETLVPRLNEFSKDRAYGVIYDQWENCRQARIRDYENRLRQGYSQDFIHPYNIRLCENMLKFLNEVVAPHQENIMALIFNFNNERRDDNPYSFIATIYSRDNTAYVYDINGTTYTHVGGKRKKTRKRKNKKSKTRRNRRK